MAVNLSFPGADGNIYTNAQTAAVQEYYADDVNLFNNLG